MFSKSFVNFKIIHFIYFLFSFYFLFFLFQEELFFEIVKRAQNGDSTINSHPIYQPVAHPNEIIDIFDAISYKKVGLFLQER